MDNLNATFLPLVSRSPELDTQLRPSAGVSRRGAYIREVGKDGVERVIKPVVSWRPSLQKRDVPFIPGQLIRHPVCEFTGADLIHRKSVLPRGRG